MQLKDAAILLSPVILVILALALVPSMLVPAEAPLSPPPPPPAQAAPQTPGPADEPTSVPEAEANVSQTTPEEGTPADGPAPAAPVSGNPDNGRQLFVAKGCNACHTIADIEGAAGTIGPELTHIGTVAQSRKPGMDAEAYIRESIREPAAFIAPDFSPAMPQLPLSDEEVNDLVAMLLQHE